MHKIWFCLAIIYLTNITTGYQVERSSLDSLLPIYRAFRSITYNIQKQQIETPEHLRKASNIGLLQKVSKSFQFSCDPKRVNFRSEKVPESAHKVRPGDIDIVGAIGDSLTAAFGATATNFLEVAYENRGRSFSIGGEENWRKYLTLPNIMKTFNPKLFGYSLNSLSTERKSRFNVAEGGAVSKNMPYMADVLVKRITRDKEVDLKKQWKMITFMVGDNDFCSEVCYENELNHQLKRHKEDLVDVLRILRDNLPRSIINIVPPPHLQVITEMYDKPQQCHISHSFLCPCLFGSRFESNHQMYFEYMTQWQAIDVEVSNMKEFDRDDFTVIPHLFTLNYTYPTTTEGRRDYSYLSFDCFHFSQKGQARFANDLWNSIMTPFGKKLRDGTTELKNIICPSKRHPYIFTRRNSPKFR